MMAAAVAGEDRELGHLPEPEAHRRLQVFCFVSAPLGRPSTRALARAGDGRERQRALGRVTVQPEGPSRARFLLRFPASLPLFSFLEFEKPEIAVQLVGSPPKFSLCLDLLSPRCAAWFGFFGRGEMSVFRSLSLRSASLGFPHPLPKNKSTVCVCVQQLCTVRYEVAGQCRTPRLYRLDSVASSHVGSDLWISSPRFWTTS